MADHGTGPVRGRVAPGNRDEFPIRIIQMEDPRQLLGGWFTGALAAEVRTRIDALLTVPESAGVSIFEELKTDPGKPDVNNLQVEIQKLTNIRAVGVCAEPFTGMPWNLLQMLKRRAASETASQMRDHPAIIRYALVACFLYVRAIGGYGRLSRAWPLISSTEWTGARKSRSIATFSPI